jgi:hypothetical protein
MEWKVDLFEDYQSNKLAIRIFREVGDRFEVMAPMMSDGKMGWGTVSVAEGEEFPMTIELGRNMIRYGVLDALITALENHGARAKKDITEATVGAMSNHLSDLQTLLFGSDTVQISRRGGVEVPDADL